MCFFHMFLHKRDLHFFYLSWFHGFSGLFWLFYELVEILLARIIILHCTWLKPCRLINLSSIFFTLLLLASACSSHETKLDYLFFQFFPLINRTEPKIVGLNRFRLGFKFKKKIRVGWFFK
jgi:hypothetical protein